MVDNNKDEIKKPKSERDEPIIKKPNPLNDNIDLGDADDSSGNLGMDNFKTKEDKNKLPSEKGRIEEL